MHTGIWLNNKNSQSHSHFESSPDHHRDKWLCNSGADIARLWSAPCTLLPPHTAPLTHTPSHRTDMHPCCTPHHKHHSRTSADTSLAEDTPPRDLQVALAHSPSHRSHTGESCTLPAKTTRKGVTGSDFRFLDLHHTHHFQTLRGKSSLQDKSKILQLMSRK